MAAVSQRLVGAGPGQRVAHQRLGEGASGGVLVVVHADADVLDHGDLVGARPALSAPFATISRLAAICSGVHQLRAAPSDASPARASIFGPRAPSTTGTLGGFDPRLMPRSVIASPWCSTVAPASRARSVTSHSRIVPIGRSLSSRPSDCRKAGTWRAPDPTPRTNLPPLISPTVAAQDAIDATDQ